jgi:hypothetical protein
MESMAHHCWTADSMVCRMAGWKLKASSMVCRMADWKAKALMMVCRMAGWKSKACTRFGSGARAAEDKLIDSSNTLRAKLACFKKEISSSQFCGYCCCKASGSMSSSSSSVVVIMDVSNDMSMELFA